jgi:hypothetical protein
MIKKVGGSEDRCSQMTHRCYNNVISLFSFSFPFYGSISSQDHEINHDLLSSIFYGDNDHAELKSGIKPSNRIVSVREKDWVFSQICFGESFIFRNTRRSDSLSPIDSAREKFTWSEQFLNLF